MLVLFYLLKLCLNLMYSLFMSDFELFRTNLRWVFL